MADASKRYQVFVSSTCLDLRDERQAVIAALLESDAFPAGMELSPAADEDAWTLIKHVIDDSDYYVLVIGGKYGSIDPQEAISYTEKEYNYAVSRSKPVMAFLHGEPGQLSVDQSEKSEEMQSKLDAFRMTVEFAKHVKYWTTADGLAGHVSRSFNRFVRQYPAVGWIRADKATSTESLQALADARAKIDALEGRLGAVNTSPPPGTEGLSQGDQIFGLPIWVVVNYVEGDRVKVHKEWMKRRLTWNKLFSIVCPKLLQESEEQQLRAALIDQLETDFYQDVEVSVRSHIKRQGGDSDEVTLRSHAFHLDDEDFGTILFQLVALGLIQSSTRKRSVTDTGVYWSLTPYGHTRAILVRALKTNQSLPSGVKRIVDETATTLVNPLAEDAYEESP